MNKTIILSFITLMAFQVSADPISIQSITLGENEAKQYTLKCATDGSTSVLTVRHTGTLKGVRTFQSILGEIQDSRRITSSQIADYTFCGTDVRLSVLPTGVINVTAANAAVTLTDNSAPVPVHANDAEHEGVVPDSSSSNK